MKGRYVQSYPFFLSQTGKKNPCFQWKIYNRCPEFFEEHLRFCILRLYMILNNCQKKKACYLSYLNWNLSERKRLFRISLTWTATAQSTTHTGNNSTWANLGDTGRAWIHKYTINMQTTRSSTQRARSSHTSIVLQLCSTLNQQLYQLTPGRSQCINNLS